MTKLWVNEPATDKQLNRLTEIERLFGIKFEGRMTKGGVWAFIGQHRDNFFDMEDKEAVNESFLHFMEDKNKEV
jgi:hypothetical protein